MKDSHITRRGFCARMAVAASPLLASAGTMLWATDSRKKQTGKSAHRTADKLKARIAITLDLEMSREYPQRGMLEWDYQKGNLDDATKKYAVEAARVVKERGGVIHFFCVGRVLEQPDVEWLRQLAADGHPVGNHTYDHVNVKATKLEETQFRFRRSPWLVAGKTPAQVIEENIRITTLALKERTGIDAAGFRTPGGFREGLADRPDVQKLLLDQGFTWVSSKYPAHATGTAGETPGPEVFASIVEAQKDAQPFVYPTGLIEIPMSPISDVTAFRSQRWKLADFLKAIRPAVEWAIRTGGVFDFLAHPSCLVVEDPEFQSVKLICDLVNAAGDRAEIVDLATVARRAKPTK
jgi:peptidoglycan/xylan/chitin deacetylase (PgdA/CDA1 family)